MHGNPCISATSATSEKVFSTSRNVVTARRTNKAVENIEKIVHMKENIKKIKVNLLFGVFKNILS